MNARLAVRCVGCEDSRQSPALPVAEKQAAVRATVVHDVTTIHCTNAGSEGSMSARLVKTDDGWEVKQLRPLSELDLLSGSSAVAIQIESLRHGLRNRTSDSLSTFPTSFVPEYSIPLEDHKMLKQSVMSEQIWAGSPSLFTASSPLGPHFKLDVQRKGVQRFMFYFAETGVRIEWAAMYVPEERRAEIGQLHLDAARLLADAKLG
eukprot:6178366-Pleurochrysis_carterae.AAC.1